MPETDRSTDTRSRIIDAAARLLQEDGPDAVTTRAVARGAGVQPPALYRLFGDKDGLLDAVAEHVLATYVRAKAAVVDAAVTDDVDPVEDLRAGWDAQIDFGLANPTLFRLLSDPVRGPGSPAARSGQEVLAARIHRIALVGRLRVGERRAVQLVHAAGTGAVLTLLAVEPGRRDRDLADDVLAAVLRQILVDPVRPPVDEVSTHAVALRAQADSLDMLTHAERTVLVEWLDRVVGARPPSGGPSSREP